MKAIKLDIPAELYGKLFELYFKFDDWSECERYLEQIIEIYEKQEICFNYAGTYWNMADVFERQGKLIDAEIAIIKGIETLRHLGETHQEFPKFHLLLARIYYLQGRLPEAKAVFALVIGGMKSLSEDQYTRLIELSFYLSDIYKNKQEYLKRKDF